MYIGYDMPRATSCTLAGTGADDHLVGCLAIKVAHHPWRAGCLLPGSLSMHMLHAWLLLRVLCKEQTRVHMQPFTMQHHELSSKRQVQGVSGLPLPCAS